MSDRLPPFPPLPAGYDFATRELEILATWRDQDTFRQSLARSRGGTPFTFYEGPPTANNKPHVGHVVTRLVKDLFPRFQTMRGHHVPRKAGWDTHGLPVEIEVEKALGFSGKQDIEAFGVAAFNARCLDSVHTYERQWRQMSERVGYWLDFDDAYFTYHNRYIESEWWALQQLWNRGLLYEGYKVQPYCARCGTTLSSHEVAQNYQDTDDPSLWALFPLRPGQRIPTLDGGTWKVPTGAHAVAWTTTPWTVLAHVALAVHPDLTYRLVADPVTPGRLLIFGDALPQPVPLRIERAGDHELLDLREQPALARFSGDALAGLRYDRPFRLAAASPAAAGDVDDEQGFEVQAASFVNAGDGTGIVHSASYGEDDDRLIRERGLPRVFSVSDDGNIVDDPETRAGGFAGVWFKEADPAISRELRRRGLLLHLERARHNYPFCWRCDRPLLYYPARSWFIRTTAVREKLLAANRQIGWHPAHMGEGRFGRWLEGVVDWALSRRRYWGTPLPVWQCRSCGAQEVMGSYAELFARTGRELPADPYDREQFDPHRPYVDTPAELDAAAFAALPESERPLAWLCPATADDGSPCGGLVARVDDVIDAWFDSGAMSFAQHHYRGEALPGFDPETGRGFPADFISEAVDQTRGWFYTLHALGVLLFDSPAYRNCIVLGHINDDRGRKMSKRLGNVVDPMTVIEETGADAMRWYFCAGNPELGSRFSADLVREAAQRFLIPIWNAVSFFTIYANLDGWRPADAVAPTDRPALDRWVLARLDATVDGVTAALEAYEVAPAARLLEDFVDDLTNWYIRRSRDRFWAGAAPESADKVSAYTALYTTLTTLTRLIAPFTPFLAESLHAHLVRSQDAKAPASVHFEAWPEPAVSHGGAEELLRAMADVQRIVRLGRAARTSHELKTRQPLSAVTVIATDGGLQQRVEPYLDVLREELNVHEIRWAAQRGDYVQHEMVPVFPRLGPRLGRRMPALKAALAAADGDALAAALAADGRVELVVEGELVELSTEDLTVRLVERDGLATAGDTDLLVALDTELNDELIAEGWAREVVHRIQTARKEADLDYAARITVRYRAAAELTAAVERHATAIARETLAEDLHADPALDGGTEAPIGEYEFCFRIEELPAAPATG